MSSPINVTAQLRSLLELEGWPSDYDWSNPDNLLIAMSYGHERLVAVLLEKGCPVPDHSSSSPALRAAVAEMSWPHAFEQMLTFGASVEARNCRGDTALHLAFAVDEASPVVNLLMERFLPAAKDNSKNCDGLSLLHIACAKSTHAAVQELLGKFLFDIDCQISSFLESPYAGYTPLHFAVHHGKYEIAALLLKHDADLYAQDRSGSSPLHLALNRGNTNMIDLILHNDHLHNNCVNNSGVSHFMSACAGSITNAVEDFLRTAETVQKISASVLINDRVKDHQHQFAGYSPLHFAARCGNLQMVQVLLKNKASCFAVTNDNLTPLDIARSLGFDQICQLLQRYGEERKDDILVSWMESMMVN